MITAKDSVGSSNISSGIKTRSKYVREPHKQFSLLLRDPVCPDVDGVQPRSWSHKCTFCSKRWDPSTPRVEVQSVPINNIIVRVQGDT